MENQIEKKMDTEMEAGLYGSFFVRDWCGAVAGLLGTEQTLQRYIETTKGSVAFYGGLSCFHFEKVPVE